MSLSSRLTDGFTRVGQEFKSVRGALAQKYTKPATGIPLEDISTAAKDQFTARWGTLLDIPATFPPETHNHVMTQVTGLQTALNAKVSSASGGSLILWTGTVANLPATKNANTIYLAW